MRNKETICITVLVFYFITQVIMADENKASKMTLVSKGNWKNYYGFDSEWIHEIVKIKGAFYRLVFKHWKLIPVGDALKKSQFILTN